MPNFSDAVGLFYNVQTRSDKRLSETEFVAVDNGLVAALLAAPCPVASRPSAAGGRRMRLEFANQTVAPVTIEAKVLSKKGDWIFGSRFIVTLTAQPYSSIDGNELRVAYAWKRGISEISDESFRQYAVIPESSTVIVFNGLSGNPPGEVP
jgi:hypothetical protein